MHYLTYQLTTHSTQVPRGFLVHYGESYQRGILNTYVEIDLPSLVIAVRIFVSSNLWPINEITKRIPFIRSLCVRTV